METRWLAPRDCRGPIVGCVAALLLLQAAVPRTQAGELPFPVGVRAGATVASLSFENLLPAVEDGDRVGYFLAGHLDYPIVPQVAIEVGLGFADQGGEVAADSLVLWRQTVSGTATIRLTYMYIPLLIKFIAPDLRVKPYVKVGPQLGILLSSKVEYDSNLTGKVETDIDEDTKGTEAALYFSGGVEFSGRVGSFLEVGYTLGLTGISEEETPLFSQAENRVLVVSAGFLF